MIDAQLSTPAGKIKVHLEIQEHLGNGEIKLTVRVGSRAKVLPPEGWTL
jgi:hypothetical protein